jgi:hypothetical protein
VSSKLEKYNSVCENFISTNTTRIKVFLENKMQLNDGIKIDFAYFYYQKGPHLMFCTGASKS